MLSIPALHLQTTFHGSPNVTASVQALNGDEMEVRGPQGTLFGATRRAAPFASSTRHSLAVTRSLSRGIAVETLKRRYAVKVLNFNELMQELTSAS